MAFNFTKSFHDFNNENKKQPYSLLSSNLLYEFTSMVVLTFLIFKEDNIMKFKKEIVFIDHENDLVNFNELNNLLLNKHYDFLKKYKIKNDELKFIIQAKDNKLSVVDWVYYGYIPSIDEKMKIYQEMVLNDLEKHPAIKYLGNKCFSFHDKRTDNIKTKDGYINLPILSIFFNQKIFPKNNNCDGTLYFEMFDSGNTIKIYFNFDVFEVSSRLSYTSHFQNKSSYEIIQEINKLIYFEKEKIIEENKKAINI